MQSCYLLPAVDHPTNRVLEYNRTTNGFTQSSTDYKSGPNIFEFKLEKFSADTRIRTSYLSVERVTLLTLRHQATPYYQYNFEKVF